MTSDPRRDPETTGVCAISHSRVYAVFSTVCAFYLPLLAMTIIYARVYRAARRRIRKQQFQQQRQRRGCAVSRRRHQQTQIQLDDLHSCQTTASAVPPPPPQPTPDSSPVTRVQLLVTSTGDDDDDVDDMRSGPASTSQVRVGSSSSSSSRRHDNKVRRALDKIRVVRLMSRTRSDSAAPTTQPQRYAPFPAVAAASPTQVNAQSCSLHLR